MSQSRDKVHIDDDTVIEFGLSDDIYDDEETIDVNSNKYKYIPEISEDEKQQLIKQISGDSEYLKEHLSKLSVEAQLEAMIDIYQSEQRKDPEFLKRLQENYCVAESMLYKLCTLIGVPDEIAKSFTRQYLKLKSTTQDTYVYKALQGTFDFVMSWKGLLVILLFEWLIVVYTQKTFIFLGSFVNEMGPQIAEMSLFLNSVVGNTQWFLSILSYLNNKLFSYDVPGMISSSLTTVFNSGNDIVTKLGDYTYLDIFENYAGWVVLITGGVVLLLWGYYLLQATLQEIDKTNEFCGKNIKDK